MAQSKTPLDELYANMLIEDKEEGRLIIRGKEVAETKQTFVLVGRFLVEKNITFNVMQNVMTSPWRPNEGMEIHDLGGFRYSFVFYHIMDLQKVVERGSWSFEYVSFSSFDRC